MYVCLTSGPAVCVDWTKAVHGRCGLAWKEDVPMWGYGVLGSTRSWAGNVYCTSAHLPHLLFLEEEQKVVFSFFSFISPVYVPNSLLSSSSYISTSLLPVAPSPFASLTHFLCFSFLSKTHSSLSLHRLLVNVQERHSPCFSYSNNCIACFLLGWSISTPGWWCLPIRNVRCQELTAVLWWRARMRETWRMKLHTQSLLYWGNSKP